MRMTKRKKELLRVYQRERARGFQAKWALSNARTRLEWDKHEVAEYSSGEPIDPKRGDVRLRVVPDETCSLEDLEGDCFNPKANPEISASRLQHDREEFMAKVNRDGVWGMVGEYFDGETWQHADSCFDSLATIGNIPATTPTSCEQPWIQQKMRVSAVAVAGQSLTRRRCANARYINP